MFSIRFGTIVVLCVIAYSINLSSEQWVVDDEGCRTPDRDVGACIEISKCKPILDILQRQISSEVRNYLQGFHCGFTNTSPKVCCPYSGKVSLPNANPEANAIPDVSNHKNIDLLPNNCGSFISDDRIVNGENALLREFPWMALLGYYGNESVAYKCGGTIINQNYILTAAHCLKSDRLLNVVTVRVGEHSTRNETDCETSKKATICNPPVQDLRVEELIPHPQYSRLKTLHDIGLIRVSRIDLNAVHVQPVCLPLRAARTKKYSYGVVTGWGKTNLNGGRGATDILQKVRLDVSNKTACQESYEANNIKLGDKQFCAFTPGKDSCRGDSGGPFVVPTVEGSDVYYVQQGIVSFGPELCGIQPIPGVYTAVRYYMDWILDNMRP